MMIESCFFSGVIAAQIKVNKIYITFYIEEPNHPLLLRKALPT